MLGSGGKLSSQPHGDKSFLPAAVSDSKTAASGSKRHVLGYIGAVLEDSLSCHGLPTDVAMPECLVQ